MVRCLREFGGWRLEAFLTLPRWNEGDDLPSRFSALSFRQLQCVARFVRFMADWEAEYYAEEPLFTGNWQRVRGVFWPAVESWI